MGTYEQALEIVRAYVETAHKGNVRAASTALKLKDPSILGQWLDGRKKPRLESIAPALDLIGAKLVPPDEKLAEYALILKRAAKPGAGSSLETGEGIEGFFAFRKDWLNKLNIPAGKAELFDVVGDSMEPTFRGGDTLLVDRSDTEIQSGKIYVVTFREEFLVKRVQKTGAGVSLLSDNKLHDAIPIKPEDMDKLRIHGRVRWFGREL